MRSLFFVFTLLLSLCSLSQTVPGPSDANAFSDLNKQRTDLNLEIPALEKMVSDYNLKIGDEQYLRKELERAKSDSAYYQDQLKQLRQDTGKRSDSLLNENQYSVRYYTERIQSLLPELVNINAMTKAKDSVLSLINVKKTELLKIENRINQMMIPKISQQNFMFWTSIAFVLLMSFLLGTFFFVISRDSIIRQTIFGTDSGIQFITLFSIVIAIIIFGLTGVLEGKELSALLGSVAGYILGKAQLPREPR